ncbi:MAG: head GIN domain-containing protein [bacterium]
MKYTLLISFLFSCVFLSAQSTKQVNDPNAEQRELGSFSSILIKGPFTVFYSKGTACTVAVSAGSQDMRDKIETKIFGSQLSVKFSDRGIDGIFKNQKLRLYVSAPNLSGIECAGAVDFVIVDVLNSDDLLLNFSGSSDIKGKIEATRLKANFSGASDLDISGSVKHANIVLSGAGDCDALELKANEADVKASGASTIRIHALESLKAVASGASKIIYSGDPSKVDRSSSGASSVRKL